MISNIVLKAEVSKTFSTGKRKERDHRNNEKSVIMTEEQTNRGLKGHIYRRTDVQNNSIQKKRRERERERGKERSIKNRSTEVNLAEEQKK